MTEDNTVVVAMSGGVDSSVAAGLLKQQGYAVVGATLQLRPCGDDGDIRWCCGHLAEEQARAVAGVLGIPHYVVDSVVDFENEVLRPAWEAYDRGRTPSPCILCNQQIKFRLLSELGEKIGAKKVATGHYARLAPAIEGGAPALLRGVDRSKDQSYFLFSLSPEQLRAAVFPLGELHKTEVRELAREMGLANAERPESQDACFVYSEGGFAEALRRKFGGEARPGDVVDREGNRLKGHGGIHQFTVGQRKGLGVALGTRAYVTKIDSVASQVVLSDQLDDLYSKVLTATDVVWTGGQPPVLPVSCSAQIRYRHAPAAAVVEAAGDGQASVVFSEPQKAVAPGQAVVFYDGDRVLGGGWIDRAQQSV